MIPSISQGVVRLFAVNLENLFFRPNAAVPAILCYSCLFILQKRLFFLDKNRCTLILSLRSKYEHNQHERLSGCKGERSDVGGASCRLYRDRGYGGSNHYKRFQAKKSLRVSASMPSIWASNTESTKRQRALAACQRQSMSQAMSCNRRSTTQRRASGSRRISKS